MPSYRWHVAAALLLTVIGSLRIAATWRVFNHTIDEPDNIAAGLEYLGTGRYLYHDQNPPLERVFTAVGPLLAGERYHPGPLAYLEGLRILGKGDHYDRVLALARAGVLPFFWMASAVVFWWGLRVAGPRAALGSTALFTGLPPVLALSGIANTDMAAGATVPAAALASLYWAARPTRGRSVLLGILTALAILSKFTAFVFLPAAWIAMALVHTAPRELAREFWRRRRAIGIVLGIAALATWAAYGFTFARVDYLHLRLPAPRLFTGLHAVWQDQHAGRPAYVLGTRSRGGFWYYYPVVLAIKVPLGFWALAIASVFLLWRVKLRRELALVLAFSSAIVLVSLGGQVNVGVRYLLPALAGFAVAGGVAMASARGVPARLAAVLLCGWHLASGALQHPDYLAYTNEIAGSHPERFVADSDLDWGQDMKRLAAFLQAQGATHVAFSPFNRTYELPVAVSPSDAAAPSPGWNAVSVTIWKVFGFPAWPDRMPEGTRIGRGIVVWRVPP